MMWPVSFSRIFHLLMDGCVYLEMDVFRAPPATVLRPCVVRRSRSAGPSNLTGVCVLDSCARTSCPKRPRTSAPSAPARRASASRAARSTVSSPTSCARCVRVGVRVRCVLSRRGGSHHLWAGCRCCAVWQRIYPDSRDLTYPGGEKKNY